MIKKIVIITGCALAALLGIGAAFTSGEAAAWDDVVGQCARQGEVKVPRGDTYACRPTQPTAE